MATDPKPRAIGKLGRTLKWVALTWVVLALGLGTSFVILRRPETAQALCRLGASALAKPLGFPLTFGSCKLDPFSATLAIENLSGEGADGPTGAKRSLSLRSLELQLSPLQALAGGLEIEQLRLSGLSLHWPQGAPGPTKSTKPRATQGACWTRALRLVHVDHLELRDAQVDLGLPGGRVHFGALSLESQLSRGVYHAELSAQGAIELPDRPPIALERLEFSGDLDIGRDRAKVNALKLTGDNITLDLSGAVADLCRPEPELQFALQASAKDLAALVAPKLAGVQGDLDLKGSYHSRPEALDAQLVLSRSTIEGYTLPPSRLSVSGTTKRLQIDGLHADLGPQATVDATGWLEPRGRFPLEIDLKVHNGPFAHVMDMVKMAHSWVDFRAEVTSHLGGHVAEGFALNGPLTAEVSGFTSDDTGWDQPGPRHRMITVYPKVQIQSELHIDKEGVHFERAHLRSPNSEAVLDALVHYDNRKGLNLTGTFNRLELSELKQIAGLPWAGQATLAVRIDGPYAALMADGEVGLENFHFLNLHWGSLRGSLSCPIAAQKLSFPALVGRLPSTDYRLDGSVDFAHDNRVEAKLAIAAGQLDDVLGAAQGIDQAAVAALRHDVSGELSATAQLEGPASQLSGQAQLTLPVLEVFDRQLRAVQAQLRLENGKLILLESLRARQGEGGELSAQGQLGLDGRLNVALTARRLSLERLLWTSGPPRAAGLLDADLRLLGRLAAPEPSGSVTVHDFEVLEVPLGTAEATLSSADHRLTIAGKAGDEVELTGSAQLAGQVPFQARLGAETRHLERYLAGRFEEPAGGALTGALDLHGDLLAPDRSSGVVQIDHLEIFAQRLRLRNLAPLHLQLEAGALRLAAASFEAGEGRLTVEGSLGADGQLLASLNGEGDARTLEGLIPKVEHLGGALRAQASVRGTTDAPAVVGSLQIENGQFAWKGLPLSFTQVTGRAEFSQHKVILSAIRGELNGGELTVGGELLLHGWAFNHYDLQGTLKNVALRIPESIPSRVEGTLQLVGDPERDLRMIGKLDVGWARYTRNFDIETMIDSFRAVRASGLKSGEGEERAPLRLDIQLHGDGDLRVENDVAHLSLQGDLKLTGTSEAPGLFGQVVGRNGLVDFRGYRYQVPQALFSFADADRIAPSFDISADTDARQYRVFVHAYGTPSSYQVQLSSQPALSEEDVAKLLTIGVTSQDNASSATTAGAAGYLGDVLWNISGLHDQVRRFIPRNDLIKDFSFNLGSAFIEATGQVEPVARIESRVLTDRLSLRAQLPLSEAAGKRAQAEYQLNDHLSVQGEWNNDYSDYSIGDFGLDLRARWEFGD